MNENSKENYEDISHSLSLNLIDRVYKTTERILNKNFEDIRLNGNFGDDSKSKVYVMPHKSYWDPLIFTFSYYSKGEGESLLEEPERIIPDRGDDSDKSSLTFAAGDDVIGNGLSRYFLRKLGCFSVKREMGRKDMRKLLDYMSEQLEKHDILFFPEQHSDRDYSGEKRTGRSLTGKIGEFSSLYLGAVRRAAENGIEVQLVPSDITYQELPEAHVLGEEINCYFNGEQEASKNFWERIKDKMDIFYSEKLPSHLSLGDPIDYEKGRRKEIGEEIEERVFELVKPTPGNVVAQAVNYLGDEYKSSNLIEEVERIYDSLRSDEVDTSLLDSKKIDEIIEEGKDSLSLDPLSRTFNENLIELYKNQIQYIL